MRYCRYLSLAICLLCMNGWQASAQAPSLTVERQGDRLRVSAPLLHVLEGKPLEQLQNGASVTYVFSLALTAGSQGKPISRQTGTFVVSFDLWEERFSIVQTGNSGRSGSHLTVAGAEAWFLENMSLPVPALSPEKPFVLKLECHVEESDSAAGADSHSGLTLAGLIDVFSRKGHPPALRWETESGPLRLADLKGKRN